MDMKTLDDFFGCLDEFSHKALFDDIEFVWDPLRSISSYLDEWQSRLPKATRRVDNLTGFDANSSGAKELYVRDWIEIEAPLLFEKQDIYFEAGVRLEPSAIIKGPCYIGKNCEIRQGAYLRGNVIVGEKCVIGHNTELKNSVIMDHSEAGHFNYIGDSILGSYVNMGAGAKLANVQFRSPKDKLEGNFPSIKLYVGKKEIDTRLPKFGAVLGDYVEIGSNAVISPGALVGKNNWVYPNLTLPKGVYPPNKLILPPDRKVTSMDR